jgi:cobalamin biosynthesis Mg chelatase CobN
MHILLRERHGLEETAAAEDLGQAPADLVVLSFADSDLGAFAAAWHGGRETLPSLRLANLRRLAHPLSVDLYLQNTLSSARGILIRLLGGIDYWRRAGSRAGGGEGYRTCDHPRRRPARSSARCRLESAALDAAPPEDAV